VGNDDTRFWVVWEPQMFVGRPLPSKPRYAERVDAEAEARRLARLKPGVRLYVLEAQVAFEATGVVRTELLPF
jgi:hypothetical protein